MTERFIPENSDKLKVVSGVGQPSSINPDTTHRLKVLKSTTTEEYFAGISHGDITTLSRAITLVESNKPSHQEEAARIIEKCLPRSGASVRIGITGVPGVGKSTFIEALGMYLIRHHGKKVAVLAVDPSSSVSKGSILGDKTRMQELSGHENAYIRPSPTGGSLGGVARKTRETIILCEAAGFDTILIETVGVGQSETTVHSMVDFFLLLMLAGAGDELQGIKRGIMELADMIVINKSDDQSLTKTQLAVKTYQNALHLFPPSKSGWQPEVMHCSSIARQGIDSIWQAIQRYFFQTTGNGYFLHNRQGQALHWFHETIYSELARNFVSNKSVQNKMKILEKEVSSENKSPFDAASEILSFFHSCQK